MTTLTAIKILTASAVLCALCTIANAASIGNTQVNYGGYIKLDSMWSNYSSGVPDSNNVGRDFYVPSTTPVGDDIDSEPVFDMHARQPRFYLSTSTKLDDGNTIDTVIELDFIASASGGNERATNSYAPRIRQAFVKYDGWLFGQAWSNFQNVAHYLKHSIL